MCKKAVNRIVGMVCVMLCFWTLSIPCFAAGMDNPGPMRLSNITTIECKIVAKDGNVSGQASVSGRLGVDRCKISMTIQRKDGTKWVSVGSWSEETEGRNASMTKTVTAKKGSTYRVSISVTAWKDGQAETKSMTSAEKVA